MDWVGVFWYLPPKGITTLPAPMVESNRSQRPCREQRFRSPARVRRVSWKLVTGMDLGARGASTAAEARLAAPLVLRKARERSATVRPFQRMTMRPVSVTTATTVASRFSWWARAMKRSASPGATTTAMRSWDSEMASSVASRPSYFLVTLFRSMSRESASSPTATDTPPAPKSLHRLMRRTASPQRNSRWSLRSSGALPFWTSAEQVETDWVSWRLEEPVAPPMPSRPVRPPRRITTSPGAGRSRRTLDAGAAPPTTAPHSRCLAI